MMYHSVWDMIKDIDIINVLQHEFSVIAQTIITDVVNISLYFSTLVS
jgi:hypothetical protein